MALGFEAAVVEDFRGKGAQVRVEPPRVLEEEAAGRRHRGVASEHVRERRAVGAVGMAAVQWLVELLRIAEQNQAVGRSGHGDDVGERYLAGLVDEQDVDGIDHLRRRPQPRGPCREVRSPVIESRSDITGVLGARHARVAEHLLRLGVLDRKHIDIARFGGIEYGRQEIADDLVAGSCDADAFARVEQLSDHPGARVRLARSRRALDRQGRVVERRRQAFGGLEVRLAFAPEILVKPLADTGRQSEQQVAAGAGRSVGLDAVISDPLAKLVQGSLVIPCLDVRQRDDSRVGAARQPFA